MSSPAQNDPNPVPEVKKNPAFTEPLKFGFSIILKDWLIWFILILALGAGVANYYFIDKDLGKSLAVVAAVIGVAGIWFAYARLIASYEQQDRSMQQRDHHHREATAQRKEHHEQSIEQRNKHHEQLLKQRNEHQAETINFYKRKASQDIITEWYKEFGQKSLEARNFRIKYANAFQNVDFNAIKKAIEDAEQEEIELIRQSNLGEVTIPESKLVIRKNIIPILNYFEKISISILCDSVDENMLKMFFNDSFVIYQRSFQPLIDMRRNNAHNGTPSAFENYLTVVKKWQAVS